MTTEQITESLFAVAKAVYLGSANQGSNEALLDEIDAAVDATTRASLMEQAWRMACLRALNAARSEQTRSIKYWCDRAAPRRSPEDLDVTRALNERCVLNIVIEGHGALGELLGIELSEIADDMERKGHGMLAIARLLRSFGERVPARGKVKNYIGPEDADDLWQQAQEDGIIFLLRQPLV